MRQESFERRVREYYEGKNLSGKALDDLRSMIQTGRQSSPRRPGRRAWFGGIAAAILAGILLSTVLYSIRSNRPAEERTSSVTVADRLASEAAMCHNQNLSTEIEAADYEELRAKVDRVSFSPVEPDRFHNQQMKILGARYTMLHGQPAIQVMLRGPDGRICTLYQVRAVADLASLDPATREVDGLTVDLWNEKGLVMVLAR